MELDSLDRIYYRLDMESVELYRLPLLKIKTCYNKGELYGLSSDIFKQAVEMNKLPELFVDESYYYSHSGMAPYRLTFAILRRWKKVSDFYLEFVESPDKYGRKYYFTPSVRGFGDLLRGRIWQIKDIRFWIVIKACKMAGIELAELFSPYRIKRRGKGASMFNSLKTVIGGLDDVDIAAVGGFARLLLSGDVDVSQVMRLVEWRNERKRSAVAAGQ